MHINFYGKFKNKWHLDVYGTVMVAYCVFSYSDSLVHKFSLASITGRIIFRRGVKLLWARGSVVG
jgi:hypothetical protein